MSAKRKILLQLDTDSRSSSFDAVVAVDSGAEVLLSYDGVTPDNVQDLVYGAIFTRGPEDLRSTAIFVGGSDVGLGEQVVAKIRKTFFGPLQVSVMLDCGGANTTAAAAVIAATRHDRGGQGSLEGVAAVVLGSTGPVGRRVVRLLARAGAKVRAASRSLERAAAVADEVNAAVEAVSAVEGIATSSGDETRAALDGQELVIAAGGLGVCLLPSSVRASSDALRVAIDLNAVPPEGIEGVKSGDRAKERDGHIVYGAIGIGGIKMKIHKAAVASLFESNDRVLDAEEIFDIGLRLEQRIEGR